MPETDDSVPRRRRRAVYRAEHRGTKEMDWLLGRFAAAEVAGMSPEELTAFEQLLALPDPDLEHWIMHAGETLPAGVVGDFIARLRKFHGLEA